MNVLLLHNADAGPGDHSATELVEEIEAGGHRVTAIIDDDVPDLAPELDDVDLVVAAGGDGTVDKVAIALAELKSEIPMTVLPLGTANNVARTLGLHDELPKLIKAWTEWSATRIDLAAVHSGDKRRLFVEAVGVGVFPRVIQKTDAQTTPPTREHTLARDLAVLQETLLTAPAQVFSVEMDGVDCSGRYLVIQVQNVPFLGPAFPLAAHASASDGWLDVVCVAEADRDHFLAAVAAAIEGGVPAVELPGRRAKRVVVAGSGALWHRDGKLQPDPIEKLDVRVAASALKVLAPKPS